MNTFTLLIALFWFSFWVYWFISARGNKPVIKSTNPGQRFRFIFFVIIVLILSHLPYFHIKAFTNNSTVLAVGIILCGLGLALAVWARIYLGRNWNVQPSIQQDHELVTSGPYKWMRHPIYTGMLVAFLGSTFAGNPVWLIIFIVISILFIRRIKIEEGLMLQLFPEQYTEYKKRTKALIPFVW